MRFSFIVILCLVLCLACSKNSDNLPLTACSEAGLLSQFTNSEQQEIYIYQDGTIFIREGGGCQLAGQYFDPDYLDTFYTVRNDSIFLVSDTGELFPSKNSYTEDFEIQGDFRNLFIQSISDTDRYWNTFTLQSPSAPTVAEYNALKNCIMENTCDFIDNRFDLVNDPSDNSNQVMQFTSVGPTQGMITAKASITSPLGYFPKGSEVWFQARFYLKEGTPFSLVDFENGYFLESPGPRLIIRDNRLEWENKFGAKINYDNNSGVQLPSSLWFTVKIYLSYSEEEDGQIKIWQDGELIIDTAGINLPTANSLQNELEIGITATQEASVLLVDDIQISDTPF